MKTPVSARLAANFYLAPMGYRVADFMRQARAEGAVGIGLTVAALDAEGAGGLASLAADHGLSVSSLNSAGYFLFGDATARARQEDLNKRLVEAAARMQAHRLVVIAGGIADSGLTLEDARVRVADALGKLDEAAGAVGVRLALEPIHPMDLAAKGCINSVQQALSLVRDLPSTDLVIDLYHTHWDAAIWRPEILDDPKLALVQVCDWLESGADRKPVRAVPGRGMMDIRRWLRLLNVSRYCGPVEFEMFDQQREGRPVDAILAEVFLALREALI